MGFLVCEEAELGTDRGRNKARRPAAKGSKTHLLGEKQEEKRVRAGGGLGTLGNSILWKCGSEMK